MTKRTPPGLRWTMPAATQFDRIIGKFGGCDNFLKLMRGRPGCPSRQTVFDWRDEGLVGVKWYEAICLLAVDRNTVLLKSDWLPDVRPGATMTWTPDGWIQNGAPNALCL